MLRALLIVSDVLMTSASVIITYWIRVRVLAGVPFVTPFMHDITVYLKTIPFICLLLVAIFHTKGLYKVKRGISGMGEFLEIVRGITFGVVIVMAASFLRKFDYSRLIVLNFWLCNIVLVGSSRALIRHLQKRLMAKGYGKSSVIVVGSGETAKLVIDRMRRAKNLGYQLIGVVDDGPAEGGRIFGLPFLGQTDRLPEIVCKHKADEVFFAKPSMSHQKILNLVARCEGTNAAFRIVSDLFEIITSRTQIDNVADTPIIELTGPKAGALRRISKTVMDYVIATVLLILSLPLWIIIPLAIKLDSDGPVLFKQTRVGKNGKRFVIYKFRTMFKDVDAFDYAPTEKNDKRITRIGRILRRMSIDELPQLINVIKGEMSLVGPRPEMPFIVEKYDEWQKKRLDVKPGITGLWQVLGRKDLPLAQNLQYDFYYIKNRSVLLDIVILVKTIKVVILGRGAY